jgi:hypothetical protein
MKANMFLRLTAVQHAQLMDHLFPQDGCEAVAFALCGRVAGPSRTGFVVSQVYPIPYEDCVRLPDRVEWHTRAFQPLLELAARRGMAVVKIHSHPGGQREFSEYDDSSDCDLFDSVYGWMDTLDPHASLVMLPAGELVGRAVLPDGRFETISSISVIGDEIVSWYQLKHEDQADSVSIRSTQAFGRGTIDCLKQLSTAVIGCSGTGSLVIEQLIHYQVGRLVLVDPDVVEDKNRNRIPYTRPVDARDKRPKVDVLADAAAAAGLGTIVETYARNVLDPAVVRAVSECDLILGCVDTVEGRHVLNQIATFYLIPYFDVGVRLDADGHGGVNQIVGTVNYIQPGRSSLFTRGLYTMEQLRAEGMKRTNPEEYSRLLEEKYIKGVNEDKPAVISINMFYASLAVNEFLARIHPYRDDPNSAFASYCVSLTQALLYRREESEYSVDSGLAKHTGRGDCVPLLDRPDLTEGAS